MRALVGWAICVAVVAAGCGVYGPTPVPSPSRSLGPGEVWLTVFDNHGGQLLCAGGGTIGDFQLHGSPTDPRIAWMTRPDGQDQALVWPLGTSARFDPDLEVIGPDGTVVAREGSHISGGCGMANGFLAEFGEPFIPDSPTPRATGPRY